jgi:hypothetical protein
MATLDMGMADVVHLEAERVSQVVARLFGAQAGHHGRAVGDVDHHQIPCLGQRTGDLAYPVG